MKTSDVSTSIPFKHLAQGSFERDLALKLNAVVVHLQARGYAPIGRGSSRVVFKKGPTIIKVPTGFYGAIVNVKEAALHAQGAPNTARCRVVHFPMGSTTIPLCVMEKLYLPSRAELRLAQEDGGLDDFDPDFTDEYQLGYDRRGRLKAYDYGCSDIESIEGFLKQLFAGRELGYKWLTKAWTRFCPWE